MYPPKQPGERDDRDDTPPGSPYSYSWPDGAPYAMSSEELEFCGRFTEPKTPRQRIIENIGRNRMVHNCDRKTYKFLTILKETEKAWLLKFTENDDGAWFPKSLCERTGMKISGPASFMDKKIQELLLTLREPVKIGTQLERCPYCGKDTGCDCASPGHKPKVTLIPAPPADLAAQIAKAKLKKFVEENR